MFVKVPRQNNLNLKVKFSLVSSELKNFILENVCGPRGCGQFQRLNL